jgi:hypothetical protein
VRFTLESAHPYPFNLCYCSICRKTAGAGGFAINLGGQNSTLQVEGLDNVATYRARLGGQATGATELSLAERRFCKTCGSALWAWDPRWPELVHPFASAIDTPLPVPPERTHLMLGSKASWVTPGIGAGDRYHDGYPQESIADWHARHGLVTR